MKQLSYKNKPIGSLNSLAQTLGISLSELENIAKNSATFYFPNKPIIKPNGKTRQTYRVKDPLFSIQKKIVKEIISGIDFPEYLQGSIKDPDSPRDYISNAKLHVKKTVILKEDISTFFSSTNAKLVFKTWKYFCNFPHEVATVLTNLTTYKNYVPEGAPTSSAIANLVFWDHEPELEYQLRQNGYIYSRYVDDVTVSFANNINKKDLQDITTKIYGMFIRAGLKPNRGKRIVQTKRKRMAVHKLNVNSERPTLSKIERSKIRAAVKEFETLAKSSVSQEEIKKSYEKVNGRVNRMKRLHPDEAQKYIERIKAVKKQKEI